MKIGELKAALKHCQQDADVVFDFCGCQPGFVASWRGSYDEPSISWRRNQTEPMSVADVLRELEIATSGKEYCGWKGGNYQYTDNHELHVDNPGECHDTEILSAESDGVRVVLHTAARGF